MKNTENIFERLEEEYFIMGGTDAAQECDLKDSDAENAGNMIEYWDKRICRYIRTAYEWCILYDSVCSCRRSARIIISLSLEQRLHQMGGCFSWDIQYQIGAFAFTLMYPRSLAGFIAFSIAGRAALAPAMIGAMVAMNEEIWNR